MPSGPGGARLGRMGDDQPGDDQPGDDDQIAGARPMFPLSTVLFPGAPLPLQVFEPRYQRMMEDCLGTSRSFGVVLISRGSEVGGGEARCDVGTMATIERISTLPDGRSLLLARGTRRFRVERWLPDDPYPRAALAWLPDAPSGPLDPEGYDRAASAVRRARALLSELRDVPALDEPDPALSPEERTWLLCGEVPLNPFDRQRLLECPGLTERLELLGQLAAAAADDLAALLAGG